MFDKILIANRGEIAVRVARTCKRLGIRTVAVYSEADAGALHVSVVRRGASDRPGRRRGRAICARIASSRSRSARGAQAIHPGYGFLSENEDFAEACERAGIVFIGPPASAIRAMGSKSAAKQLMEKAGVPLVPGYHGEAQDLDTLAREADRIGYPVLIKASAGGGGKGMRIVESAAQLEGRAGLRQARGGLRLRRRPRADREVPHAPAPHRDAGVRRHARQRHSPVRARLLGAAAPPEGAGGGARPGHDRGAGAARWAPPRWPRRARSDT